jgi:hypothetical protein
MALPPAARRRWATRRSATRARPRTRWPGPARRGRPPTSPRHPRHCSALCLPCGFIYVLMQQSASWGVI